MRLITQWQNAARFVCSANSGALPGRAFCGCVCYTVGGRRMFGQRTRGRGAPIQILVLLYSESIEGKVGDFVRINTKVFLFFFK